MKKYKYISKSEFETKEFAKKLANYLTKKDIVILTGDLGSRKN